MKKYQDAGRVDNLGNIYDQNGNILVNSNFTPENLQQLIRQQQIVNQVVTPNQVVNQPLPKPVNQSPTKKNSYTGYSIVDFLKSIGEDSSKANRKRLAKQHGLKGDFTAQDNLNLLNALLGSTDRPLSNAIVNNTTSQRNVKTPVKIQTTPQQNSNYSTERDITMERANAMQAQWNKERQLNNIPKQNSNFNFNAFSFLKNNTQNNNSNFDLNKESGDLQQQITIVRDLYKKGEITPNQRDAQIRQLENNFELRRKDDADKNREAFMQRSLNNYRRKQEYKNFANLWTKGNLTKNQWREINLKYGYPDPFK